MNSNYSTNRNLSETSMAVLKPLLYFNIFNHPLRADEVFSCCSLKSATLQLVVEELEVLVEKKLVVKYNNFYAVQSANAIVARREAGEDLAKTYMNRVKWVVRLISSFPFIRGVLISGSLSKNYMDKGSDVDYFIITKENRLWLSRSILAIMRKFMIGPFHKYFCFNYWVSTTGLSIPDKNLFTATELVFLIPVYGDVEYKKLINENLWIKDFYPHKLISTTPLIRTMPKWFPKYLLEWFLSGRVGDVIDNKLHTLMSNRWKKRYSQEFKDDEREVNIRTQKQTSKQHEKGHQFIILKKYAEQIATFEKQHQVVIENG